MSCDVVTAESNCLTTTVKGTFTINQQTCLDQYGSNLVKIASFEQFTDVGDLCGNQYCWIGIESNLTSCNNQSDFKLQYVDGSSFTDYNLVKWCNGYPNNLCSNASYIYIDSTNSSNYCLKNDNMNEILEGICGNPVQCIMDADEIDFRVWMF